MDSIQRANGFANGWLSGTLTTVCCVHGNHSLPQLHGNMCGILLGLAGWRNRKEELSELRFWGAEAVITKYRDDWGFSNRNLLLTVLEAGESQIRPLHGSGEKSVFLCILPVSSHGREVISACLFI